MDILLNNNNWEERYASVEQFVSDLMDMDNDIEGHEFQLVSVRISVVTRYRIKDGKPVAVEIAFPTGLEEE